MQPPHRPGFPPYARPPYGAAQYQGAPSYAQPGQHPYQRPSPPMGRGGAYNRPVPRPAAPAQTDGSPPKNTTLWVGKIASSIEPGVVRALMEACGPLKEWKPATDPKTGALKGFGFCTYREPEGVIVALEVLNGLVVDGQALALKCNSATDAYIQWFKSKTSQVTEGGPEEGAAAAPAVTQPAPTYEAEIAAAREKTQSMIADRPQVQPVDPTAAANHFLSSFDDDKSKSARDGSRRDRDRDRGDYRSDRHRRERDDYRRNHRDDYDRDRSRRRDRDSDRHAEEGEIRRERKRSRSREVELPGPEQAAKVAVVLPSGAAVVQRPLKRPLRAAFEDEEDEAEEGDKKSRKLIPIQYSAEELRAAHEGPAPGNVAPAQEAIVNPALNAVEERKKQLLARVPKEKDALFAYPVKWEVLDSAPENVKGKLAGWINKKVKALVGDDADGAGFAEFLVHEVWAHHSALKILENVQDVLDEDAEPFVVQLFKLLIFHTEELALEKQS